MEMVSLDELSGEGVNWDRVLAEMNSAEAKLLNKLVKDFGLRDTEVHLIILALYRFKKTCKYYVELWKTIEDTLTLSQKDTLSKFLGNMEKYIDCNSRRCFSNTNFFAKIRYILHACAMLGKSYHEYRVSIRRVCNFRIILATTAKQLVEDSCWPTSLPHVYMHRCAGFLRTQMELNIPRTDITKQFNHFLWEHNVTKAHTRWFNNRYRGSYGSRQ